MYSEETDGFYEYRLYGILIFTTDDNYIAYEVESGREKLFYNGRIISSDSEDIIEYMLDGDSLYLMRENEYIAGKVISCGENIFLYRVSSGTEPEKNDSSDIFDIERNPSQEYGQVDIFQQWADDNISSYHTTSETFTNNLLMDVLTNVELTDQDKTELYDLNSDMKQAVIDAVTFSTAASMSYYEMLFGGEGIAEQDESYRDIIDLLNSSYENSIAEAEQVEQDLHNALTEAFADGTIDIVEHQNILNYAKSYDEALSHGTGGQESGQDGTGQRNEMLLMFIRASALE